MSKYQFSFQPFHPKANSWGAVRTHILLAEEALGRLLPEGAQVHHVDEDKGNNSPGNLVICQDQTYHRLLHLRTAAYRATGDPTQRRCVFCKCWSPIASMSVHANERYYHKSCAAGYQRGRRS